MRHCYFYDQCSAAVAVAQFGRPPRDLLPRVYIHEGVPRRQPHRRSGLATLPSVGAIPSHPVVLLQSRGFCVFFVSVYVQCIAVFCVIWFLWVFFSFVASFLSVLRYCWLGLLTCKIVSQSQITYTTPCPNKKHVTTFSTITSTISVRLQ